jgi:hypothetical protein
VTNPAPGGGTSNVQYVSVAYPTAQLRIASAVDYGSGGFNANSVVVADVNGDGNPDLVVANNCAEGGCNSCNNGSVAVLLGNGDGTFQAAATFAQGGTGGNYVAVGDVNGDGKLDLVVINECNNPNNQFCGSDAEVFLGNGDGTFESPVTYNIGGTLSQFTRTPANRCCQSRFLFR